MGRTGAAASPLRSVGGKAREPFQPRRQAVEDRQLPGFVRGWPGGDLRQRSPTAEAPARRRRDAADACAGGHTAYIGPPSRLGGSTERPVST